MSGGSSPTIGTGKVWAVLYDMGCIAFLTVGGRRTGIDGSRFDCFRQSRWFSFKGVFCRFGTFAGVSFILISSHCPEHVVVLDRLFTGLEKLPFIVSRGGGTGFGSSQVLVYEIAESSELDSGRGSEREMEGS